MGNTIYLTTADKDGNMVSLIQSNYRGMGSGMTPGKLGFILQDRGELFALEEGHMNVYAPHKRPFHTIIPAFITKDGEPFISFGLMGIYEDPGELGKGKANPRYVKLSSIVTPMLALKFWW